MLVIIINIIIKFKWLNSAVVFYVKVKCLLVSSIKLFKSFFWHPFTFVEQKNFVFIDCHSSTTGISREKKLFSGIQEISVKNDGN